MKWITCRIPQLLLQLLLIVSLVSCATGPMLSTRPADTKDLAGSFTLVLYGCNYMNDLETVAVLDAEGDEYTFQPYAPDFQYRLWKGVPAQKAVEAAEEFVRCNPSFSRVQVSSIVDTGGKAIGYEIRPLYLPFAYGLSDVIDVLYWLRGNKVFFSVKLLPPIERMLNTGTDRDSNSR
jgi:hypothetical protein